MYEGYRVVAVTPAGRRQTMEILKTYIFQNRDLIDEWQLWVNTCDVNDIQWMREQASEFVRLVEPTEPVDQEVPAYSINQFFRGCVDRKTIYIRFDDDIVYVHPMAVRELCRVRLQERGPFLVYANVVNNAICTHIHQRLGALSLDPGKTAYWCLDPLGWKSGDFAVDVHCQFLKHLKERDLNRYLFSRWVLWEPDRFSINCFAFLGEDFAEFNGHVPKEEEVWLSMVKPRELGRPCMIAGGALVSHYAFYTQKGDLDQTDILGVYRLVAELVAKEHYEDVRRYEDGLQTWTTSTVEY